MKILVKLGGTLLDSPESRAALAAQIAGARGRGVELVVVHGGGKQMTRFLAERGIESRFVNGLRVTTPETIDAVLKVFAGLTRCLPKRSKWIRRWEPWGESSVLTPSSSIY